MQSQQFDSKDFCGLDAATMQRLADLAARAHARTSATGVAIALLEDAELVTCASFGPAAPDVGTRAPIEGSFSGRCAQSCETLLCDDVLHDDRVNGEACAAMGILSMVMVPVQEEGTARGVLAAFSDRPNSFSASQLTVLNTFAEIANELLQHRDQARSGEPAPVPVASVTDPSAKSETVLHDVLSAYEADRIVREKSERESNAAAQTLVDGMRSVATPVTAGPAAPVPFAPAASIVKPTPVAPLPEAPRPQIVRSTSATRSAVATKMALADPVRDSSKPASDTDLLSFAADPMSWSSAKLVDSPKPVQRNGTDPVPQVQPSMPTKKATAEFERTAPIAAPEPTPARIEAPMLASFGAQSEPHSSTGRRVVIGGIAVLVLAGAVFGFSRMGHRASSDAPSSRVEMPAPNTQAAQESATTPTAVSTTADAAVTVNASEPAKRVEEPKHKDEASALHADEKNSPKKADADAKQAEPLFIRTADAKKTAQPVADVPAPNLMAHATAPAMPEFKSTASIPKADFPVSSAVPPKLINGPRPTFPQAATALHLKGDTVVLNAKVLTNGKVGEISVVRGHPIFVGAVKEAVKRWQYSPARLDNQPTDSTVEIVFTFGPAQQ
jgi:TonB family protein